MMPTATERSNEQLINEGKICKYCFEPLARKYRHPIGCEDCGGKAKIEEVEGALE
jgi:hypothetical protein